MEGRVRLCTKSLFFDPDDVRLPIVRCVCGGIHICLGTSAGPEANYRVYQMSRSTKASEPKAHARVQRHIAAQHPAVISNKPRSTGLRARHAKRAQRLYVTSRMHRPADPPVGRPPAPRRHAARVQ